MAEAQAQQQQRAASASKVADVQESAKEEMEELKETIKDDKAVVATAA